MNDNFPLGTEGFVLTKQIEFVYESLSAIYCALLFIRVFSTILNVYFFLLNILKMFYYVHMQTVL